ncbi:MAG: hypothetical protein HN377_00165 [Alphaproteobacteria bacterium]|jgi:hypothetical protein|nr:hypothetical protein [Alphaproteobacteria bacterium]
MRIFIIALLLVWGGEALAEDYSSANYNLPGCQDFVEGTKVASDIEVGFCVGRVGGIWSMLTVFEEVCSPKGVTNKQIVQVIIQYITQRPARMHERFDLLALEALRLAWPCEK